ncbi:MAG: ATP-dependent RNA helicase RhlE [Hyphomicrobiaceae bacterium]|jgi:ATP-dependent RNA helicase RhlE
MTTKSTLLKIEDRRNEITTLSELKLIPELIDAVADMGYSEATPIQAGAIPIVLGGRDLIGCAATGTGKTAAFLLPVLQILSTGDRDHCRALILSPTRELALQIDEQAQALGYHLGLSAAPVVGGVDMGPQETALKSGAAMIVATPGRLLDHMRFAYTDLSKVEIVILDEADRMLDMGFLPDITRILDALPKKRQTLMFSATMSPTIRKLASKILTDPDEITVDRQAPALAIEQTLYPVAQERKAALLSKILKQTELDSVLVFVRRKLDVNRVASGVRRIGINAGAIHSGRTQEDRIDALEGFRTGRFPVLIATDVAARGLDINTISHVINFDVPHSPEDYIHRAGRTGRAGKTGDVITFVAPDEEDRLRDIQREIGIELERSEMPDFDAGRTGAAPSRGRRPNRNSGGPSANQSPRGNSTSPKPAAQPAAQPATNEAGKEAGSDGPAAPRRRRRRGGRGGGAAATATPEAAE